MCGTVPFDLQNGRVPDERDLNESCRVRDRSLQSIALVRGRVTEVELHGVRVEASRDKKRRAFRATVSVATQS